MIRFALPILGIALGTFALTSSANAQGFEVTQNGAKTVLVSKPELITDALKKKFDPKKSLIEETIKRDLIRPNFVASGITLHGLNPHVGGASCKFVSTETFEIKVTDNVLAFSLSKPASADASSEPEAEIHFDIVVRGTLFQPTTETPQLAVIDATISTANVSVKERNVSADGASDLKKVSEAFEKMNKDRNPLRSAFDRYLRMELNDQINKELRPISKKIAELVKAGMEPSCSLNGSMLRVSGK